MRQSRWEAVGANGTGRPQGYQQVLRQRARCQRPNGLCFSPDEKKLYICDTGFTDGPDNPSHIRVFDVDLGAGKLSNSKVFADIPKPSITDGLRCDTAGRLWCSVGWGDPTLRVGFDALVIAADTVAWVAEPDRTVGRDDRVVRRVP